MPLLTAMLKMATILSFRMVNELYQTSKHKNSICASFGVCEHQNWLPLVNDFRVMFRYLLLYRIKQTRPE